MSFLRRFRRKSGSGSRDSSVVRDEGSCNSSRRNSSVLSNSSDSREGSATKVTKKNRLFSKLSNSLSSKEKDKTLTRKTKSTDGEFYIDPYNTYQKNAQPDPTQDDPDPFGALYDKQMIKSDPQYTSTYKIRKPINKTISIPPPDMDFPKENEEDKYKTVTLSTYRKYFRDKYLNDQNKQPIHNPSWFVEVEKKPSPEPEKVIHESPQEVLVYDNDNYRRNSRSPLRNSRSPVRRTDTFKVTEPTIRIQIRNSPQKIVPVGVAKPIVTSAWNKTTTVHTQYQPTSRSTTVYKPVQQRVPYQTRIQIKPQPTSSILVSPSTKVKSITHFGDHIARPGLVSSSERLSRPNIRVPPNNNRRMRIPSKSPIKIPWR